MDSEDTHQDQEVQKAAQQATQQATQQERKKKYYLSACILIRTIEPFLFAELLHYYRLVGVEHFYIFDNLGIYDLRDLLRGNEDITLHIVDGETGQENVLMGVYNFCMYEYREETEYLVYVDDDEFINFTEQFHSIPEVLRHLEEPDLLVLNWLFMGCGTYRTRPFHQLLLESNQFSGKKFDIQTKCIYRTSQVEFVPSPHFAKMKDGSRAVDGAGDAVPFVGGNHQLCRNPLIWEHHYFIQSRNEFRLKCERGHVVPGARRDYDKEIQQSNEQSVMKNIMMARWIEKFKEKGIHTAMDAIQQIHHPAAPLLPVHYLSHTKPET